MSLRIECGVQSCFIRNGITRKDAIYDAKNKVYISAEGYEDGGFVTIANSPINYREGFSIIGFFVNNGEKVTGESIGREDAPIKIKALRA